jgi:hypothetical protein
MSALITERVAEGPLCCAAHNLPTTVSTTTSSPMFRTISTRPRLPAPGPRHLGVYTRSICSQNHTMFSLPPPHDGSGALAPSRRCVRRSRKEACWYHRWIHFIRRCKRHTPRLGRLNLRGHSSHRPIRQNVSPINQLTADLAFAMQSKNSICIRLRLFELLPPLP